MKHRAVTFSIIVVIGLIMLVLLVRPKIAYTGDFVGPSIPFLLSEGQCNPEDITVVGGYRICQQEVESGLTVYLLEILVNQQGSADYERFLYHFRYLPSQLRSISLPDDISQSILFRNETDYRQKIYISVSPDFTSGEVFSTAPLVQALGRAQQGIFRIETEVVYNSINSADVPVVTCDEATNVQAVIIVERGDQLISVAEDCIYVRGADITELRKIFEKITFRLFNVA